MNFTKLAAATLILLSTSHAMAAGEERPATEVAAEKAYIDNAFSKIDSDHDGNLSKSEWDGFMAALLKSKRDKFAAAFTQADTNQDGKISKAEAKKANILLSQNFASIDTNNDGFLTPAEIRAALNAQSQD